MNWPDVGTPQGRQAWAFVAMTGAAMAFTVFAAFGIWMLRNSEGFMFWLALAAHMQIFVVLTSLGGLIVRRSIRVTKDGAEYEDLGDVKDIK